LSALHPLPGAGPLSKTPVKNPILFPFVEIEHHTSDSRPDVWDVRSEKTLEQGREVPQACSESKPRSAELSESRVTDARVESRILKTDSGQHKDTYVNSQ